MSAGKGSKPRAVDGVKFATIAGARMGADRRAMSARHHSIGKRHD